MRRALFSLQYRYLPSRWYYPKAVREAFRKLSPLPEGGVGEVGVNVHDPSFPPLQKGMKSSLKLATGFLNYNGVPNWRQQFDDPEQTMSLHRWGWLIYGDVEKKAGIALMRSWISAMGPVTDGIAGTPYTTSERIVNALLFLSHGEEVPEDLHAALLKMAYHVARHIEYHGVRGTGNHVVNDARALFFAGQMLGVTELSNLALSIIQDALPWLVTEDGFLREESSHYHLLFTRWIMEIYELAKETHHQEMETCLEPWITQCAKKCEFFLVQNKETGVWQIPLIGDVSPDCTPEWLIKYLMSHSSLRDGTPSLSDGLQAFSESGWFRLDRGPITIFWHIPQSDMIHRATHGHSDACSFVLFNKGKPILIDPGRTNYRSNRGCLAQYHNALTVDGFDPFLYDRAQKFPALYQRRNVKCDWKEEAGHFVFSIAHVGFQRIQGDRIDHTRRFLISDRLLTVEDELRGKNAHMIETFFHIAPDTEKIEFEHSMGKRETIDGWTFPSYGVKISSISTLIRTRTQFPVTLRYRIRWRDRP